MVEFRFDIRPLFPQPIVKVTSNLLPHTFRGDRRQALDTTSKMSEIIDRLGQLSAHAQKLTKPVTTAQRLRMSSNQTIYLLADVDAGKNGAVVGLLKVGTKDLYLFDEVGQTRKVENAACILDFYIHESRQRSGLGKELFETMLEHERWLPVKCSVDRPSEKLLGFLSKHYGLVRTIPQANNFVLYEGFFDGGDAEGEHKLRQHANGGAMYVTNSPNTQLLGAHYLGDDPYTRRQRQLGSHSNINNNMNGQITQISPVGRYGARRPTGSMAEIIHNNDSGPRKSGSFTNSAATPATSTEMSMSVTTEAIEKLTHDMQSMHTAEADMQPELQIETESAIEPTATDVHIETIDEAAVAAAAAAELRARTAAAEAYLAEQQQHHEQAINDNIINNRKPLPTFHLSKQHTGMKNISFGVGMAVTPTNKMEFDQEAREDFGIVKINRPMGKMKSPPPPHDADNVSTVSSAEGLTEQGYYDLKFYHNKLW